MIDRSKGFIIQSPPMIDLAKWQNIVNLIAELFDAPNGSITQCLENEFIVVCTADNEHNFQSACATFPWEMQSYCRKIIESSDSLYVKQASQDAEWQNSPPAQADIISYLGFPITWPNGELFGSICVADRKGTNYSDTLKQVLAQFRDLINADLALACQFDVIKEMSITDDMTQCYNRRGLVSLEQHEIGLAERFKCGLGVVFLDIDNMKLVNDKFGHKFGDMAITLLADVLKLTARSTDVIARIGGDEFVLLILLNETVALDNMQARILDNYHMALREIPELDSIDVSIGSQTFQHNKIPSLDEMLRQADLAMYQEKRKHKLITG